MVISDTHARNCKAKQRDEPLGKHHESNKDKMSKETIGKVDIILLWLSEQRGLEREITQGKMTVLHLLFDLSRMDVKGWCKVMNGCLQIKREKFMHHNYITINLFDV